MMSYYDENMELDKKVNLDSLFEEDLDTDVESELMEYLYETINNLLHFCWENKFKKSKIEKWLTNFKGEVFSIEKEKRIALLMLIHFVYYNVNEVRHLCKDLFENYLHVTIDDKNSDINKSSKDIIDNTFFFPLGNPSESGSSILYYFRNENKLPNKKFKFNLSDALFTPEYSGKNIVIMDDVTLSGDQVVSYITHIISLGNNTIGNSGPISDRKVYILILIAGTTGVEKIKRELESFITNIEVITSINIDERSKAFSEKSYIFNNNKEYNEQCEKFAYHYGLKLEKTLNSGSVKSLGYNGSQLLMGFFYNIPDNTLPIFWVNQHWNAIFERADKVYDDNYKGVLANDRTIKYV